MTMTWNEMITKIGELSEVCGKDCDIEDLDILDVTINAEQIAIHVYNNLLKFAEYYNLKYETKPRDSKEYPSMITVEIDGITLFELRGN